MQSLVGQDILRYLIFNLTMREWQAMKNFKPKSISCMQKDHLGCTVEKGERPGLEGNIPTRRLCSSDTLGPPFWLKRDDCHHLYPIISSVTSSWQHVTNWRGAFTPWKLADTAKDFPPSESRLLNICPHTTSVPSTYFVSTQSMGEGTDIKS